MKTNTILVTPCNNSLHWQEWSSMVKEHHYSFSKGLIELHLEYWFMFWTLGMVETLTNLRESKGGSQVTAAKDTQKKLKELCQFSLKRRKGGNGEYNSSLLSQMQIANRNKLFITAEKKQLQVTLMEIVVNYEKNGSYWGWLESGEKCSEKLQNLHL